MIRASSGKTAARRLLFGAGAIALLTVAITGCEAGSNAPTLEFHPASGGAQAVFNGISINDAFVLGAPSGASLPAGSSASLFLSLYNSGPSSDKLVSADAPGSASSVSLSTGTVPLAANSAASLMGPEPKVVLKDLTKPLTGGTTIPVTFTFAHAGSVTLQVPVEAQSFYYSTYSPAPSPVPTTPAPTTTSKAKAKAKAKASPTTTS